MSNTDEELVFSGQVSTLSDALHSSGETACFTSEYHHRMAVQPKTMSALLIHDPDTGYVCFGRRYDVLHVSLWFCHPGSQSWTRGRCEDPDAPEEKREENSSDEQLGL